jgi:multidrug efflux pump subunit AcrA (membrane-fusion protein)
LNSSPAFLRDGMSVDVDILTTNLRNVLAVPSTAIVREGGKPFVYVVKSGKAHKTAIRTGDSNDTQTIVLSGVQAGDRLVTGKDPLLKDGSAVTLASPTPSASPAG